MVNIAFGTGIIKLTYREVKEMNMTALWVKGSIFLNRQKDKLKEAFLDETGAVDIVAVVVLIGIAVVLAVLFRNQIQGVLEILFKSISKNATDAIS